MKHLACLRSPLTAFALCLFISTWAGAEQSKPIDTDIDINSLQHPVQPALWRVEGGDLKKPSYLFGTIHLPDPRITNLHPQAEQAFQESDVIYTEIDLSPAKQLALASKLMRSDGKTMTQSIGPEATEQMRNYLQSINPALNPEAFDQLQTWAVGATLPLIEYQLAGKQALDVVLFQRAADEGKSRDAIETADSQLKVFTQFTEAEQVIMIKEFLANTDVAEETVAMLITAYLVGNPYDLAELMKEDMEKASSPEAEEINQRLMKSMLDDRNKTMSETVLQKLSEAPEKTHFFAVGVLHYTGQDAIQESLEAAAYTVTPLFK